MDLENVLFVSVEENYNKIYIYNEVCSRENSV